MTEYLAERGVVVNSGFKVVLLIWIFLAPLISQALNLSAFKSRNHLGLTFLSDAEVKNDCDFFVKQFVFDESKPLLKIYLQRNRCSLDHIGFMKTGMLWELPYSLRGNTQLQVELFIDQKSELFYLSTPELIAKSDSESETPAPEAAEHIAVLVEKIRRGK